jgi:hypothetical protein
MTWGVASNFIAIIGATVRENVLHNISVRHNKVVVLYPPSGCCENHIVCKFGSTSIFG